MTAKVLGLAKLNRKLERLPQVAKALIRSAMEQSADEMVALMKSLVPVDTGALRDSIGWTWGRAPKGSDLIGAVKAADASGMTITIFAGSRDKSLGDMDAYYARWVEFGTQKMAKHPYFFVSYRALKKRASSRMGRAARKAAKQVASNG